MKPAHLGIYDFELLPYALGDALTWNIQSAIAAHKAGRDRVDIHICVDKLYPASIYQRGLVNEHNCGLFFNDLFGAFSTHPLLGNITIYQERERMIARVKELADGDAKSADIVNHYLDVLANKADIQTLPPYFISQIYSHEALNSFFEQNGFLPQLQASAGCLPDIRALLAKPLSGRRIVVIHPRMRRLDQGYGGDHTFSRDSDLLEWMAFIKAAEKQRPEVQFIVMGRLQEKPLALLERPNVMSLRSLGLGLGHELTLMREADLFIGTSSGFAAMANFCSTPYFITKMNPASCTAYAIPEGAKSLPFAHPNQELVYDTENAQMLMELLDRGLKAKPQRSSKIESDRALLDSATTSRYCADDLSIDAETAYLLWPKIRAGFVTLAAGGRPDSRDLAKRILENFPTLNEASELVQSLSSHRVRTIFSYACEQLKNLRHLNNESLPPLLRKKVIIIPARWIKSLLIKKRLI